MTSLLVVLVVGAGSYGFRVAPLLLRDRVAVSARLDHLIRQAGTAALTALVVSSCVHAGEQGAWVPVVAAVGVGLVIAARGGSMLRIVACGLVVYLLLDIVTSRLA